MVFTDPLLALMSTSVTHQAWAGMSTDGYVTDTFGTGTVYQARVVSGQRLVRTFDGSEDVAATTVWVASTSTFSALDRWTLPDGTSPPLLSIETFRDETGVTHTKLGFAP